MFSQNIRVEAFKVFILLLQCSEFLLQMFTDGKFGWQQDENHEIHVGNMMAGSSPKARRAENTRVSRMEETAKASGNVTATWKSLVASQGLKYNVFPHLDIILVQRLNWGLVL